MSRLHLLLGHDEPSIETQLDLIHVCPPLSRAESSGYDRFKALALGHLALLRFRQDDLAAAESFALRSNTIARPTEFASLVFRNCFYLWRIAQTRGDEAGVRANERTLRVYVHRVEEHMPEAARFRSHLAGAKP